MCDKNNRYSILQLSDSDDEIYKNLKYGERIYGDKRYSCVNDINHNKFKKYKNKYEKNKIHIDDKYIKFDEFMNTIIKKIKTLENQTK